MYVFDLDGTLSDPSVGIRHCLNYTLEHYGHSPIGEGDISALIGPPLDQVFQSIVGRSSPERIAALVSKYRERYGEVGYAKNVVYPGIAEALHALDDLSIPMGICTSKRADLAEKILERFGIRQYFRFISGGDMGVRKADQITSLLDNGVITKSSLMIGDRAIDILAAKANGLRSAAVLWGYGSFEELQAVYPDALLQSPPELLAFANAV